jgi:hypothetical protein
MQAFGEIRKRFEAQPRDGRLGLPQHGDLLVQGEQRDQVIHSLLQRQFGILEWLGGGLRRREGGRHKDRGAGL